jgi:serine/threonine protein kinase
MDKYVLVRELGRGSYGSAMLVRVASDPGQLLVVKQVSIGHLSAKQRASTEKEAHLLSRMHHSNIVSYVESFTEKKWVDAAVSLRVFLSLARLT